jgi:hypothetical protein
MFLVSIKMEQKFLSFRIESLSTFSISFCFVNIFQYISDFNNGGGKVYKLENNILYPAGNLMERSKCEAKVCDL